MPKMWTTCPWYFSITCAKPRNPDDQPPLLGGGCLQRASQRCSAKDTSDADLKAIFQLLATRVVGAGFNPDGKKDRGRLSVARGSGGKPNKKCC